MTVRLLLRALFLRFCAFILITNHCRAVWHTTFCVVSAPRSQSYLYEVLTGFEAQHVMALDGAGLMVVDVAGNATSGYIGLHNREMAKCDYNDVPGTKGLPSCMDRQMSLDVTGVLAQCANITTGWVVLIEDDCVPCPGAVDEVLTTLGRLSTRHTSLARFSKFLRATGIPARKVARFRDYVRSRLYTHPYDITRVEDWDPMPTSGEVPQYYVHDRNIFHHVGTVSTVDAKNTIEFQREYAALRGDVCWQRDI